MLCPFCEMNLPAATSVGSATRASPLQGSTVIACRPLGGSNREQPHASDRGAFNRALQAVCQPDQISEARGRWYRQQGRVLLPAPCLVVPRQRPALLSVGRNGEQLHASGRGALNRALLPVRKPGQVSEASGRWYRQQGRVLLLAPRLVVTKRCRQHAGPRRVGSKWISAASALSFSRAIPRASVRGGWIGNGVHDILQAPGCALICSPPLNRPMAGDSRWPNPRGELRA